MTKKAVLEKWEKEILEYALGEDPEKSDMVDPAFKPDAPQPENKEKDDNKDDVDQDKIYFDTGDEKKKASQNLMSSGIPWMEMHEDEKSCWIKFEPDMFFQACRTLSKKYNLVDSKPKKIAVIEFDDMFMYEKAMQYIKRMGGILETGSNCKLDDSGDEDDQPKDRKAKRRASVKVKDARGTDIDDLKVKRCCRVRSDRNSNFG